MTTALALTEAQFQEQITGLSKALGWRHLHVRRSIGKGRKWVTATNVAWPDLTLWSERQQRLLVAELKTDRGVLSEDQAEVLSSLERAGVEVHVWRPWMWDEIVQTLRGPIA